MNSRPKQTMQFQYTAILVLMELQTVIILKTIHTMQVVWFWSGQYLWYTNLDSFVNRISDLNVAWIGKPLLWNNFWPKG